MSKPISRPTGPSASNLKNLHRVFLEMVPRIEQHGHVYFRHVKCPGKKEDCVAEMVAISWKWFRRLVKKGKDPTTFVSAIASFAARAVNSGRRLCGMEKPKDVLSSRAQKLRNFSVGTIPTVSTLSSNPLTDALIDNTKTPPDEQCAFRIDFPIWLASLDHFRRRVVDDLMMGERTLDVANRHGCSPGRISQLRREFMADWNRFCDNSPGEPT